MKKSMLLVLLLSPIFLFSKTSKPSTKLYNKLNSLFNSDKTKCLEVSKHKIKKKTKDPAPYIFALKCELEIYPLSDQDMFYESNPDIVKDMSNRTQRMCRYAKNVERLADKETQLDVLDATYVEVISDLGKNMIRIL